MLEDSDAAPVNFGPLQWLPLRRILLCSGQPVRLGSRASEILALLLERPGELVTKKEILARVWDRTAVEGVTLRVHIADLRKTLGKAWPGARCVESVVGHGYRFIAPIKHSELANTATTARTAVANPGGVEILHNLPAPLARMFGREHTVASLEASLGVRNLVTITGAGGIGKTTVAVATAHRLHASFPHGIYFVDFSPLTSPSLLAGTLAAALGLQTIAAAPMPQISQFLKGKRTLIVLDNCEHVIDAAAQLAEALTAGSTTARVLATSREPLRARDEWVLRLSPLELPPSSTPVLSTAEALHFPAIQLFAERAAATSHLFAISDSEAATVAEICRNLDGLPLAIELAAARVDSFGIRALAARLKDCLQVLTRGHRTAAPRQKTLRATLDWSYEILPAAEQAALCRLGVFAGRFDVAAARAVLGEAVKDNVAVVDILTELAAKSLLAVRSRNGQVRYQLFATSRAYALEKLQARGDVTEVRRLHARLCCSWEFDSQRGFSAEDDEWRDEASIRIGDVRAALDWCFSATGDTALGAELAARSAQFWFQLSFLEEYRSYLERALAATAHVPIAESIELQLNAALGDAIVYTRGAGASATVAFKRALAIAERLGTTAYHRRALWGLWVDRIVASDYGTAVQLTDRYGAILGHSEEPLVRLTYDRMMALTQHLAGDQATARRHAEKIIQAPGPAKSSSDPAFQFDHRVTSRAVLARILWIQGFPDRAIHDARETVELAGSIGHALSSCYALMWGATVAFWVGDVPEAARMAAALLELSTNHSLSYWQSWGRCLEIAVCQQRGAEGIQEKLAVFCADPLCSFLHLETLSTLAEELVTVPMLERAENANAGWCNPEILRVKAKRVLRANAADVPQAEALLQQSIAQARQQNALAWELRATTTLATVLRDQGHPVHAFELLQAVRRRYSEGLGTEDVGAATALLARLKTEL